MRGGEPGSAARRRGHQQLLNLLGGKALFGGIGRTVAATAGLGPAAEKWAAVGAAGQAAWDRAVLEELVRRADRLAARSILPFVETVNPTLLRYEHVRHVIAVLDRLVFGDLRRLLILAPPRYFKSELVSRLLPAAILHYRPGAVIGLASYAADLAWELSEDAREYYRLAGGQLSPDASAKRRWATADGGEMWAYGVGAGTLGRGYDFGIVDDPVDPEQAHSPVYQRRFARWWPQKFLSRQEPGARIVCVFQRLGPRDPADYLFRREVGEEVEEAPEGWHVMALDEIHSEEPLGRWDGPKGLPPTCTLEPDWRRPGEILAPSRFGEREVRALQAAAGPYTAAAQRQQRPLALEGGFWEDEWFGRYVELPAEAYGREVHWDTSYGGGAEGAEDGAGGADTAFVVVYRVAAPGAEERAGGYVGGAGRATPASRRRAPADRLVLLVEDCGWRRVEFPELVEWMRTVPGPHYIEARASGRSAAQVLSRYGVRVREVQVRHNKLARAAAVQPLVAAGRVLVRDGIRQKFLWGERQGLCRVTAEALRGEIAGAGLDVNDAFVQAALRALGAASTTTGGARGRGAPALGRRVAWI